MSSLSWSRVSVGSAGVVVVLVLVQAVIAGQWLNGAADIELHGYIGNAAFVGGIVAAASVFVARGPLWLRGCALVLVVFLFAQTGLGYVGRESAGARSVHIPMGVASFGLAVACLTGALGVLASLSDGRSRS